mmetsp:Transcript_24250/g.59862  ORF Transcript_24250/g.59862 Transcript_24250/m.59862 type:complete len:206 (+) Transcript_24250:1884-2501(+)
MDCMGLLSSCANSTTWLLGSKPGADTSTSGDRDLVSFCAMRWRLSSLSQRKPLPRTRSMRLLRAAMRRSGRRALMTSASRIFLTLGLALSSSAKSCGSLFSDSMSSRSARHSAFLLSKLTSSVLAKHGSASRSCSPLACAVLSLPSRTAAHLLALTSWAAASSDFISKPAPFMSRSNSLALYAVCGSLSDLIWLSRMAKTRRSFH